MLLAGKLLTMTKALFFVFLNLIFIFLAFVVLCLEHIPEHITPPSQGRKALRGEPRSMMLGSFLPMEGKEWGNNSLLNRWQPPFGILGNSVL